MTPGFWSRPVADLKREFAARGPWITRFDFAGVAYGGDYHAAEDTRLRAFRERFPAPARVLELGSLEGGHTFPLAAAAGEVVAVESRRANVEKARWLQGVLGLANVTFLEANLESFDLGALGRFDAIFNCGLLYHLPEPWLLLERLARLAPAMLLWTHVAGEASAERGGYPGLVYPEHGEADPLSGMSPMSFWPTQPALEAMLAAAGFAAAETLDFNPDHPHGPAVLMVCRQAAGGD